MTKSNEQLSALLSTIVLVCSLAVLCGWIFHLPVLIQIIPGLAPMQFNTAMCFLCLSFSIVFHNSDSLKTIRNSFATICFLIASTALIEHLLETNIGIDTLFIEPDITDRTRFAGRMSITTALSFMCSSLGFFGVARTRSENEKFLWIVITLVTLAIASSALIEYLYLLNPSHGHTALLGMALHTCVCHLFLAVSIIAISPIQMLRRLERRDPWYFILPFFLCISLSVLSWDGVLGLYKNLQQDSLVRDSKIRSELIKSELTIAVNILEAVRLFYLGSSEVSEDEFQTFVEPLTKKSQALLAIDWTPRVTHDQRILTERRLRKEKNQSFKMLDNDRQLTKRTPEKLYFPVIFTYPNIENGKAFGFDHYSDELRLVTMDRAAKMNRLAVTTPFSLFRLTGRYETPTDALFVLPVVRGKIKTPIENAKDPRVEGFIIGVIRMAEALEKLVRHGEDIGLNASLFYTGKSRELELVHTIRSQHAHFDQGQFSAFSHTEQISIGDSTWMVTFSPTSYYLKNKVTVVPSLLLVFFLFSSFLLPTYFFLIQHGKIRALKSKERLARTNQALREREEWFAQLARTSPVGIFRTDSDGNCVYVNDAWCKLTGLSVEQALYDGWSSAVHPDDRDIVFKKWKDTAERGEMFQHEFRFQHRDGTIRWTIASSKPVFDSEKRIIGHVGTNFDLTEQKSAEEEIRNLSSMQSAIIDNAGYSIISTTLDGVITSFNPTAEEMLGYKAEEMIGKLTPAVFHDEEEIVEKAKVLTKALGRDIQPGFQVFTEAAKTGIESVTEWTYIRKDGSRFLVLLNVTPITDPQGAIIRYLGIAADITERSRLRDELEANLQKLAIAKKAAESAAEAKANFLANMSHEIRTPLTAVIGYAEQLLDNDLSQNERSQFTHTIVQSSEHLLELINDILDFSKLEAGMVKPNLSDANCFEVVEIVENAFKKKAEEQKIGFHIDYQFPLPAKFQTDTLRLRQILMNLVGNAIKFTKQGEVRLAISYRRETHELFFEVKDTGIGLTKVQLPKLFKDFSQADDSTTKKFGGTGLGLSLSKKFAEILNGEIRVESAYGIGSNFQVKLPIGEVKETDLIFEIPSKTDDPFTQQPSEKLTGHVLLVEDTVLNQKLFIRMLQKLGLEVKLAENGQIGVEKARQEEFELVLMDMQMPVMDGYTATELLRQENFQVPIVGCTADASSAGITRCLKVGCNDVLVKPFSPQKLSQILQKFL